MRAWLLRLYPEGWRRRYGEELGVFLEQLPVTPALCWDVLKGAVIAHASLRVGEELSLPALDTAPIRPLPATAAAASLVTAVVVAVALPISRPLGLLSIPLALVAVLAGLSVAAPLWRVALRR